MHDSALRVHPQAGYTFQLLACSAVLIEQRLSPVCSIEEVWRGGVSCEKKSERAQCRLLVRRITLMRIAKETMKFEQLT